MNEQTYTTKINLSNGPWVGRDNNASQPAGYVVGIPDRVIGNDSFEWVVETYENSEDAKMDMSSATAKIYAAADVTGATRTELGSGVVSGTGDYITTFTVPADTIPTALYGVQSVIILEWVSGTKTTSVYQRVEVEHFSKGSGSTPAASAMAYTPATAGNWLGTAPDDVAEGLDDLAARLGAESANISDPTGGGTVDAEARTAINAIIDALQAANIVATP
jgi:hypothetical protein